MLNNHEVTDVINWLAFLSSHSMSYVCVMMNRKILASGNLQIQRFFNLDTVVVNPIS